MGKILKQNKNMKNINMKKILNKKENMKKTNMPKKSTRNVFLITILMFVGKFGRQIWRCNLFLMSIRQ